MIRIAIVLAFIITGYWITRPQPERIQPAGVLVKTAPEQIAIIGEKYLHNGSPYDDYFIEAKASYHIKARILSKEPYSAGNEGDLSPYDLALGWEEMSDSTVLDKLNIGQASRWYRYRWTNGPPIDPQRIATTSANTHIIPANEEVKQQLEKVIKGDVVRIVGYLVNVSDDDDWEWNSSLTRSDTGDGSYEILWADSIIIEH
jgi:hypothetical protein